MNKKLILGFALMATIGFYSCGEGETTAEETTDVDTTAIVETEVIEEEETPLAFDGVEKGAYTLYGHSEIDPSGDESNVSYIMASIESTGGFEGKVIVNIDEVCQKAGCWITFENGDSDPVRVFFRDHFTIPIETASGTEAILFGQAIQDTLTVDFQKHLLDDAAESGEAVDQEAYDAITADKIETTFDCESILVKTAE
jgi:hypothetical protein